MRIPEPIADYACETGEGPLWHPDEGCVYWSDIPQGRLFRYDPVTGRHQQVYAGRPVGGSTLQADGSLLLFRDRGNVVRWQEGEEATVIEEIPDDRGTRFNDVIADPDGRVFCGTMPTADRPGRLYRLDPDGSLHLILSGLGVSNGMGFTPNGRGMYHTDTSAREISLFDYDRATGELSNRRLFVRVRPGEGGPDGMTVDAEGYVWSARWDGSRLVRYDPDGREVQRVDFPVLKVSSLTFGGPTFAVAYVTTAGGTQKEKDGEHAGALFRAELGVRGVPEFRSKTRQELRTPSSKWLVFEEGAGGGDPESDE